MNTHRAIRSGIEADDVTGLLEDRLAEKTAARRRGERARERSLGVLPGPAPVHPTLSCGPCGFTAGCNGLTRSG